MSRARAPRGTRDVLPEEGRLRERIVAVARSAFERHGYGPIVTPTFEETEVFVRGVGTSTDIVRKEMYSFADRSGRSLTLRPEGTAPVMRAFVEHGMHKLMLPVKLWYLAPMFRYEAPQAGRYREHWQLGAEAIGSDDPLLDAEVIALLHGIYAELELPGLELKLGSMGDRESRDPYRAKLVEYLERHRSSLDADAQDRMRDNPLRLFDTKDEGVAAIMADAPKLIDHLSPAAQEHRERVLDALDRLGIAYTEDPTLVRGFDYYTMTVFEFSSSHLGAQSGVGGGGRYDGLVEQLGGPPTPGIGFGTGIERITLALQRAENGEQAAALDCYLAVPDAACARNSCPCCNACGRAACAARATCAGAV
ncbi:MAG TPA: histidine--tRNA ligase [Miltoncostaeaceae bacterium]|nr:histidine--tRNA ligase [Miltoncostaeaceae bacterium]